VGWNAGARPARSTLPVGVAPAHRAGPTPACRPYAVTARTKRRPLSPGPQPRARTPARSPARAAVDRAASCVRHRRGHAPRPARLGPVGHATWLACAPLGSTDAPCTLLPRICSGAAPRRPSAPAVTAAPSSPVHPTVHRLCSSPSSTLASTRTHRTLPCTCIGRTNRQLAGIAAAAADRCLPRRGPSPEPFPAKPTPPNA
jgi:hypothetical protein